MLLLFQQLLLLSAQKLGGMLHERMDQHLHGAIPVPRRCETTQRAVRATARGGGRGRTGVERGAGIYLLHQGPLARVLGEEGTDEGLKPGDPLESGWQRRGRL